MNSTYKTLSKLYNRNLENEKEKDVCELYRLTERSDIIATYYCKHFKAILFWHKKYKLADESQTASIAMECLDYCLKNYDGKSCFKTYFNNGLKRRLLSQKQYEMGKKRYCGELINVDDIELGYMPKEFDDMTFIDTLENSKLTDEQLCYCNYYLTVEKPSDTEFCKLFKISKNKLSVLKKSLKFKLSTV